MFWILTRSGCFWFLSLVILAVLIEFSGPAAAQPYGFQGGGRHHGGMETHDLQGYDPQTVTTVTGQVESLGSYGMTGWRTAPGMQTQGLALKTDGGTMMVNLGPPWFPRKQEFEAKPGDTLEVTGSRISRDNQTWLLASEVKKGERVLKVRDETGKPLWRQHDFGDRGSGGMGRGGMGAGGKGYGRGPGNY
jgi:hypothetical protein